MNVPHCGALNKTLSTVTLSDVNTQGVGYANWLLGSEREPFLTSPQMMMIQ